MSDSLRELIDTALELMNHSFAPPGDSAGARLEFYHQFRKLWDRGIPVGMGLGHLLLRPAGESLLIERVAEHGEPGVTLAVLAFVEPVQAGVLRIIHDGRKWRIAADSLAKEL